jgi:2-keto-4-pentenoate hydratase/2-oxohepta-3-ene-1,7-dioic acid hydratase in catechol pathway
MKIFCIGKNYRQHAQEMEEPTPESPLVFLKPATALTNKKIIKYPDFTNDLHYEGELVVKINQSGKNIPETEAPNYFNQVTVGIDFTARDIQTAHKQKGWPWELAKGFDNSAIVGRFIDFSSLSQSLSFQLKRNDEVVQTGNTNDLIFDINYLIHYISQYFTLQPGDLLFTGTPSGVGPIQKGDQFRGTLNKAQVIQCTIQ